MSNRRTPGPWHILPGVLGGEFAIWSKTMDAPVAVTKADEREGVSPLANAQLIASAPDILKSLKQIHDMALTGAKTSMSDLNNREWLLNIAWEAKRAILGATDGTDI